MAAKYYLLPHHDSHQWQKAQAILSSDCANTDDLIVIIKQLSDVYSSILPNHVGDFGALKRAITSWDVDNPDQKFFPNIYMTIKRLATELPSRFSDSGLRRLSSKIETSDDDQKIDFTDIQMAALIANMFLCTTSPQEPMKYWANFSVWYSCNYDNIQAYLKVLFTYFSDWIGAKGDSTRTISFIRRSRISPPEWNSPESHRKLPEVSISISGSIGDLESDALEVDFANADPCFGPGGTQEEIILGFSPEAAPLLLVCDTLTHHDVVAISGALKVATNTGYGLDLRFDRKIAQRNAKKRFIVAMDALNYDSGDYDDPYIERKQIIRQLTFESIQHDFSKAYLGFSFSNYEDNELTIETGHWGCGAYAGNPDIKFAIQLLAAMRSGSVKLIYYTFNDSEFAARAESFLERCRASNEPYMFILDTINRYKAAIEKSRPRDAPLALLDQS